MSERISPQDADWVDTSPEGVDAASDGANVVILSATMYKLQDERDAARAELDVLRGELQAANRKLALLGNDHFVTFTNDRFTVEHSVDCRLSGLMHECEYHTAVERIADEGFDPELVGRWRIVDIADGLPSLEMAAVIGEEPKWWYRFSCAAQNVQGP